MRYHSLWCLCWGQSCKNNVQCECIIFLGETAKCSTLPSPPYSFDSFHTIIQFSSILLGDVLWQGFLSTLLDWPLPTFPDTRQCPHSSLTISTAQHPAAWSHANYRSHLPTFSPIFSCSCGQRPRLVCTLLSLLWCGWHFPSFLRFLGWAVKSTDAENLDGCISLFSLNKYVSNKIYIYKHTDWGLKLKLTCCIAYSHFAQVPEGREA